MRICVAWMTWLLLYSPSYAIGPNATDILKDSIEVLEAATKNTREAIPQKLLQDSQGVAIIPRVLKAGFVFGGRGGHGVVYPRNADGTWGDPMFVHLGGASFGLQIGVESADVILVFRNNKSLERILEGKNKLTLGADAGLAVGPLGRQAEAATDPRLKAEILSYSRSRGLFAGLTLQGAALVNARDMNIQFRKDPRKEELRLAEELRAKLNDLTKSDGPALPKP